MRRRGKEGEGVWEQTGKRERKRGDEGGEGKGRKGRKGKQKGRRKWI